MYLTDYHTHTRCSPDSEASLADMARAAQNAGLRELCTTDHCDLQQEDGSLLGDWDWDPVLAQFEEAELSHPYRPDFRLLLGLELGGAQTDPQRAEEIISRAPLDFVIGSVHNLSPAAGGRDFYFLDYLTEESCRQAMDDYFASLLALAPLPCYDSLGHIIYPLRDMSRAGHQMTLDPWSDPLDQLLSTVIHTGRAIEVNTNRGRDIAIWKRILERYRALGGELVTVGSDAHVPEHVAKGAEQAQALLRETGFRWLTVYRRRKPEQIPL